MEKLKPTKPMKPMKTMKPCSLFIIDIDLVGFSTKTESEQCKFVDKFHKKIREVVDKLLIKQPIIIPTGDGIFLGYKNTDSTKDFLTAIDFIFEIKKWADKNNLKFRSAINSGSANILNKDVNGNKNIFGNLINNTARIISAAEEGAVVIYKDYYENFIRDDKKTIGKYKLKKIDSGTVLDKHNYPHVCYSVTIETGKVKLGNKKALKFNYMTQICSSDMPKSENLKNSFQKRIKSASEVVFYGIYNSTTLKSIKKIVCSCNRKVDITVVYAADELKDGIRKFFGSDKEKLDPSKKQESIASIKEYCKGKPNITLHLKEYTEFPTFGASLVDFNNSGKGFMHISNYLQGVVPDETPYFELEYLTERMPFLYEFYLNFFHKNILPKLNEIPLD